VIQIRIADVPGILRPVAASGNPFVRASPRKIQNNFVDFEIEKIRMTLKKN
jgi:hypothetical protein